MACAPSRAEQQDGSLRLNPDTTWYRGKDHHAQNFGKLNTYLRQFLAAIKSSNTPTHQLTKYYKRNYSKRQTPR